MKVQDFYDLISKEYTDLLDRSVPRYREMLGAMLHYIPDNFKPENILELGCGTGNLTELILAAYPDATITVVDISGEILNECKTRFQSNTNIIYHQADFKNLDFNDHSFDLVLSSIAIHHIEDDAKQVLFNKIYSFLTDKGLFTYLDQCRGATLEIYQKQIAQWKEVAIKQGSSEQDWKMWMDHQDQHDFHAKAIDQMKWMEQAGFEHVDLLWRNLLWTVFYGEK